ncbi:hypothetical protein [Streptomyces sp. NPDC059909]|uniref:hypothetical protein n=1 Tax=Streptomyces sp. NPDC059909 TaxID=3346998 RepID=UPI0036669AFC
MAQQYTTRGVASAQDETVNTASRDTPGTRVRHHPRARRFESVHLWITTATGLVALVVSLYNFAELQREPDIDVTLPHLVRISQDKDVWLYLQPTLSTRIKTQEVEVVMNAELRLKPTGPIANSSKPEFFWDETGTWTYGLKANELSYQRVADPVPLLVSQDKPQQPTILFNAIAWNFQPGRYEGTLRLHRASRPEPLVSRFCLDISEQALKQFQSGGQRRFFSFRDDLPASAGGSRSSGCYRLPPFD